MLPDRFFQLSFQPHCKTWIMLCHRWTNLVHQSMIKQIKNRVQRGRDSCLVYFCVQWLAHHYFSNSIHSPCTSKRHPWHWVLSDILSSGVSYIQLPDCLKDGKIPNESWIGLPMNNIPVVAVTPAYCLHSFCLVNFAGKYTSSFHSISFWPKCHITLWVESNMLF
jgi:hypothetical protein